MQPLLHATQLRLNPLDRHGCAGGGELFGLVERKPDLERQRGDGVAQFVRDRCDEFVAGADRALQFLQPRSNGRSERVRSLRSIRHGQRARNPSPRTSPASPAVRKRSRRPPVVGMHARTVVPPPGVGSSSSVPPTARARSRMPVRPIIVSPVRSGLKPNAIVFDDEREVFAAQFQQNVDRVRARMLGDVVQRLLSDTVDACLHFRSKSLQIARSRVEHGWDAGSGGTTL